MKRIDLHVHSTASDGTMTPSELVRLARHSGLAALGLCDHDTIDGLKEFYAAAKEQNYPVVGGLELSSEYVGTTHILGLGVLAKDSFSHELDAVQNFRLERNKKLLNRLAEAGVSLSWERLLEISRGGQMGRPHFARAMVEAGYCQSLPEAFDRYLAKGRPTYVNKIRPKPDQALSLLRAAGFAPVLAHPISLGLTGDDLKKVLPQWKDWGLVGLEAYHPDQSQSFSEMIRRFCRQFDLVATAGSDYHGANKKTPLTWVKENSPLGLEVLEKLKAALAA